MRRAVEKLIKEATNCRDEIVFFEDKFEEMENVCVVTLERLERPITYVFGREDNVVYLLNNSGKTVQRIK